MKVLQVNKLYYPFIGGVEKVVYDIADQLKDKVDMEILVCNTDNRNQVEFVNDVKVTRSRSLGIYFSMPVSPNFPLMLKRKKADIYHFHMPFPLGEFSYLLSRPKGKVVATWHSDIVKQKTLLKFYKPFLMKFIERADVILTTSPQMIENSPFLQNVKEKCRVVPLGIDVKPYIELNEETEKKMQEIKKQHGERLVFFLGRLVYYKGVQYLVEAMKNIKGKLLLAGAGQLEDELKETVKRLNIEDKVVFLGKLKDEELPAYYHACDVFVLPSVASSEAFGLVQLEAMACGKPVVSTNLPTGVPFVNQHRKTGIVVEPMNVEQLAEAVNELLDNEDLRIQYGTYAKNRVLNEFTKEKMAEKILNIYKELLENK